MKILKIVLLLLGLSTSIACIVISIYVYNHPEVENAQFLIQIPLSLMIIPILIGLILKKLRKVEKQNR